MFRFIVIKKKNILYLFSCVIVLLLFSFYYLMENKSQNTFSNVNVSEETSIDLNGDGKKETLEINKDNSTYIVKVKTDSKEYVLQPSDNSKILGECSPNWPLQITTLDLSRDRIPEIIVRTSKNNKPINYIFTWTKEDFFNIYTSSNNLFGILDSKNSRTPKILSISSSEGNSSTTSYIFNNNKLKDITFSKTNVPNLNYIQSFIDLIEAPYELSDVPDIFSPSINSLELGLLWNLDKESNSYTFQNSYFYDSIWDENGNITTVNWCLSFEEVKKLDSSAEKKQLLLYLTLQKDSSNELKIHSIKR